MILQALYRLAETEGLMEDPDYEPKPVAWLVRVSKDGKLLGIEGTHHVPPEQLVRKKPKSLAKNYKLPREKALASGDRAFLLFGKSEYVFGDDPETDPAKKRPVEKLQSRFALFRQRVKDCLDATGDEGVRAVWVALEEFAAGKQRVALPDKYASNDLFTFVFAPDIDKLITDREKVRAYWQGLRAIKTVGDEDRQCLVSGDVFSGEIDNFPLIKKVPGGTTSGVALISFNRTAFESYGWKNKQNASISRRAAESCSTALNRLLHPAYPDPRHSGQTLPKRNLRLSSDTTVCFWSAKKSGDEFCSVFSGLLEANPDEVGELYRSIWRGKLIQIDDASAFYALTLTGTQGRAIVRDWFESTVEKVAANLAAHFRDLDIVRNTPKPKARGLPPQMPMSLLLKSLTPDGDSDKVPAPLIGEFVEAALKGTPYPFSTLQRALERTRAEMGREEWDDLNRRDARAAIIKAVLNRRKRYFPETTDYKEVQLNMDPTNTSEGYTLGSLMA
ncbi:MAG: type I-C CRISPR-associated protein Cas8c/Csd1, partial [bacterium]